MKHGLAAALVVAVCAVVSVVLLLPPAVVTAPASGNGTVPAPTPTPIPFDQVAALDDQEALTTLSIGSFDRSFIWVRPGEEVAVNYAFLARGDAPLTLNLSLERVDGVGSTGTLSMPAGLSASVSPAHLRADPGERVQAVVTVNSSPDRERKSCVLLLSAEAGGTSVVADDWLRVFAAETPVPGISGAYHTRVLFENESLALSRGKTVTTNCTIETGEGGGVTALQVRPFCSVPHAAEDAVQMPEGLTVAVDPNPVLVRNHGIYHLVVTVAAGEETPPGTYPITFAVVSGGGLSYPVIPVTVV